MALIVQKYGGTSMGSPERIRNVARRVARWKAQGHQLVVVVSAMSGETNRLIALAKDVSPQPDARELDVMISTGEQVTIALLAMALKDIGVEARSYTGAQVKVLTDSTFTKARILHIDDANMRRDLDAAPWSSSPASRAWMKTATSPPSAAAARIPPAWPWRRR
jgi:aspartate kinase